MTIEEVSKKYMIPMKILKEYESWGGCAAVKKVIGDWQYDDHDLERLSLIITLHEIGFDKKEVEEYMTLVIQDEDTGRERLKILEKKRMELLDEIHFKEKNLSHLDYLRYELKRTKK